MNCFASSCCVQDEQDDSRPHTTQRNPTQPTKTNNNGSGGATNKPHAINVDGSNAVRKKHDARGETEGGRGGRPSSTDSSCVTGHTNQHKLVSNSSSDSQQVIPAYV